LKKKNIRIKYTCSDYCHHEHKYKLTAWLCGRIQEKILTAMSILEWLIKCIDDILFLLGVIFLSLAGFLIYVPLGFMILGICCVACALIINKSKINRT
jgi:hypothetical protein